VYGGSVESRERTRVVAHSVVVRSSKHRRTVDIY
jgi:hypothetical protein